MSSGPEKTIPCNPGDVPGILNYKLDAPDGNPLYTRVTQSDLSKVETNATIDEKEVIIHNVRGRELDFCLERNGFQFVKRPTTLQTTDFFNERTIRQRYYPEVEQLLRDHVGAKRVVVFTHILRRNQKGDPSKLSAMAEPAFSVHGERTLLAGKYHAQEIAVRSGCEHLLKGHYRVVNVWRPICGPVYDTPLALMDYRTVDWDRDLMPHTLKYASHDVHTYAARYNKQHVWYYLREQTPEEATILLCYDSLADGTAAKVCMHSAFHDRTSDPDAPPRQSIEVRCLAFDDE